jgi:hypothetical protein
MTTRRHFLTIGSASAVLAALLPAKLFMMSRDRKAKSLDHLHHQDFAGLVNTRFSAKSGRKAVALTLISARQIGSDSKGRSFSLKFTGKPDQTLTQRIYELQHDEIGAFDVFMVPNQTDVRGQHYEVLFNRTV